MSSLEVHRVIPVRLDLGNLAVFDINVVDETTARSGSQEERAALFQQLTRDNLQLLVNELFKLPTTSSDVGAIATLPKPTTALPRAKPVPKEKKQTVWEQFAKFKGIQKRKKSSHVYDEDRQEWRPRYGAKSKKNDPMANWITELKPGQNITDL